MTKLCLYLTAGTALYAQGIITTIAGSDVTYPGVSLPAFSATFGVLSGVAVSPSGDIYFASQARSLIVRFNPLQNTLSIAAGIGTAGYSGDGGPAVNASLNAPQQIAFDRAGNLYIADQFNFCIRKIDTQGVITTFATGLSTPKGIAVAPDGSVYASDYNRILRITSDGAITVIAGSDRAGYSGDGGPASQALLSNPQGMAFDNAGNLYFADTDNQLLRRITPARIISRFAGNRQGGDPVDGRPATSVPFQYPISVAVDPAGNVYTATATNFLERIDSNGIVKVLNPSPANFFLTGAGTVQSARLNVLYMAFDPIGNLYLTDDYTHCLYRLTAGGSIQAAAAYAPNFGVGDGGPAASAGLSSPSGLSFLPDGSLLIADTGNQRIRRISPAGSITTVAGTGSPGLPTPVAALSTSFVNPNYVTSDRAGGFWVSEFCEITHINASGISSVLDTSFLGCPAGLSVDTRGNLLIADESNNQVFMVSSAGKATVLAGNGNAGYSGDGGPATAATLNHPRTVAADANGVVYIADTDNNRIRKVSAAGIITTLTGPGPNDVLDGFYGLVLDRQGNLYVTARYSDLVERISPDGKVTVVAGNVQYSRGFSGDGGPATSASLNNPVGIELDDAGNIYIADYGNNRIRKILAAPPSFSISTAQVSLSAAAFGQPVSASLTVSSPAAQGLPYSIALSTNSGGNWLSVGSPQGKAPGVLTITADPGQLQLGTYTGTVTLTSPLAAPPSLSLTVTIQVAPAQDSKLSLNTRAFAFSFTSGGSQSSQQLTISNRGAAVAFTASTATTSGGAWLQVSPSTGSASAASSANVTVTASPGTLPAGTYSGSVSIASDATGDRLVVPVTMTISDVQQRILLSQTGLTFTAVALGGAVLPQSFGILNAGTGSMSWTAQATVVSGSGWLSLSSTSGAVARPLLDVSFVDALINAQSLAPGDYYGNIQVTAPGAANSPQTITVVLNVLPPGSNPGPEVRPTGLVFTGGAAGANPGAQSVNLSNLAGMRQLSYGSSPTYVNGTNWLTYLPANATLDTATPTRIVVQPDFTPLAPGIYRGAITLALSDGSIRNVGILSVVAPAGTTDGEGHRALAPGCSPSKLQIQFTSAQQPITAALGQPVSMEMLVVDDCATPITRSSGAAVQATFSNGDPAVAMVHTANGRWSGTWQPRSGNPGGSVRVRITAFQAFANGKVLADQIDLNASLTSGARTPLPLSVLNGASFQDTATLAPGVLISVFGSALADARASGAIPLPTDLAGTQVSLGGRLLPLLFASDGQVNAQIPYDLSVNTQLQLQVKRGVALSVPQSLTVAPAQPAIFTLDQSGRGQGVIVNTNNIIVDAKAPAAIGDTVVIYCNGLGPVSPPVAAGVPAPSSPLSQTTTPVTVTIGDKPATVQFAGLTPGFAGLYQVNATVPDTAPSGNAVPVVLQVAGQVSPPVTVAIR
jgi:uncharacterized protein (TIGR03437 family)